MDRRVLWALIAAGVLALVATFWPRPAQEPPPVVVPLPPTPVSKPEPAPFDPAPADPEPPPEFVAEEPPEPEDPLPPLDDSDAAAIEVLAETAGAELVESYLVTDSLLRRVVANVDNLSREAMWINARLVPPVAGRFLVEGPEEAPLLAAANYERYRPFFRMVEGIDVQGLARAYQRHYPLLQQAYEELGYPGKQFHNRALEVIDHLLATPRASEPVRLVQPHVVYQYADPELEALSSGQKILLRVGPDNAAVARAKLIELRTALEELSGTTQAP